MTTKCPVCAENLDDTYMDEMKWVVCDDGDMFYVQENVESETYVASFPSEGDADRYCEMLNRDEPLGEKCPKCDLEIED